MSMLRKRRQMINWYSSYKSCFSKCISWATWNDMLILFPTPLHIYQKGSNFKTGLPREWQLKTKIRTRSFQVSSYVFLRIIFKGLFISSYKERWHVRQPLKRLDDHCNFAAEYAEKYAEWPSFTAKCSFPARLLHILLFIYLEQQMLPWKVR